MEELAVVVDSNGVVVRLPREVLFRVRVDACCKRCFRKANGVDCDRRGSCFGRLGGDELVQRARNGCESKLLDNVRHGGSER